mmetsp:Transcript_26193/g.44560  ORF Transcript_26193/g.44560 Transcript_26193/m.44560 type:complete len:99 (-) Transcript_26193:119-415(-)
MDVQIKFKGEVSVVDMEERNYAVEKGAPIKLKEEVCAAGMEQRSNYAVETDVQIMLGREECAVGMGQCRNASRYEGCTKHDQGGGVCRRHGATHKLYS